MKLKQSLVFKNDGVVFTAGHLNDDVLIIVQTWACEKKENKIILDLKEANALREWLNKDLPR